MPAPSHRVVLSRTTNAARTLTVGRRNYAALYVFADGADAGKGLSLTFDGFGAVPFIARITRVR